MSTKITGSRLRFTLSIDTYARTNPMLRPVRFAKNPLYARRNVAGIAASWSIVSMPPYLPSRILFPIRPMHNIDTTPDIPVIICILLSTFMSSMLDTNADANSKP